MTTGRPALLGLKHRGRAVGRVARHRRVFDGDQFLGGRPNHWIEYKPLSVTQTFTALRLINEDGCFDECENCVFVAIEREELGVRARVFVPAGLWGARVRGVPVPATLRRPPHACARWVLVLVGYS